MGADHEGEAISPLLRMGQSVFRAAPAKPGQPMLHARCDHHSSAIRVIQSVRIGAICGFTVFSAVFCFHLRNLRHLRLPFSLFFIAATTLELTPCFFGGLS